MEVRRYRKKPIVISAYKAETQQVIHTLEGDMVADPGDYIVTGIKGEKYPCKPDIFHKTYDLLSDQTEKEHKNEQQCISKLHEDIAEQQQSEK